MTGPGDLGGALRPVLAAFDALRIRHCLTGSVASSHHGVPRSTLDVDLVADLRPAQVRPLLEAPGTGFYVSEDAARAAVHSRRGFSIIQVDSTVKIDVMVLDETPFDREESSRRKPADLPWGGRCFMPSAEDILLRKLQWYEKGGRVSERQWTDVLGILQTQGEALDREYLSRWARDLGLGELLQAAMKGPGRPPS